MWDPSEFVDLCGIQRHKEDEVGRERIPVLLTGNNWRKADKRGDRGASGWDQRQATLSVSLPRAAWVGA